MLKIKITLTFFILSLFSCVLYGQTVQRSTYGVFRSITPNDSLLLAGGQILTEVAASPIIEHGYYPLNSSLLTIDQIDAVWFYRLFPNPTSAFVTLNRDGESTEPIIVEIYNLQGTLVGSYPLITVPFQIDLSTLSAGLYNLIVLENSEHVFIQKLVKID